MHDLRLVTTTDLPTPMGVFRLAAFSAEDSDDEHLALIHGDVAQTDNCTVRVHSECLTGEVFGSQRCDCREQLESAMSFISKQPRGVLIYLRQEGRGIGLLNKLRAYRLQDEGMDTIEANQYLGFPADARNYKAAASILELLEVRSVSLLTNNPDKIEGLRVAGIDVTSRISLVPSENPHNRSYLETKRSKMGHLL